LSISANTKSLAFLGQPDSKLAASRVEVYDLSRWRTASLLALPLSGDQLQPQWDSLKDESAIKAYWAMRRLLATPDLALPLVKKNLRPDIDRAGDISRLLPKLASSDAAVREQAHTEVIQIGEQALPAIRKAMEGSTSREERRRLQSLLAELASNPGAVDRPTQQALWGIELLEQMGTPPARAILQTLADGAQRSWITQEAQISLQRLEQRQVPR
jgi:hypothetical protein